MGHGAWGIEHRVRSQESESRSQEKKQRQLTTYYCLQPVLWERLSPPASPESTSGGRWRAGSRDSSFRNPPQADIRNPDNVPAKTGSQIPNNVIKLSLDTPSTSLRVVSPSAMLRTVSLSNGLSNGLSNHGSRLRLVRYDVWGPFPGFFSSLLGQ
jgi:hypothetical protein